MTSLVTRTTRRPILALAILAALAVPALAQQQSDFRSIVRYQVKQDRVAEFEATAKEYAALLKKAGFDQPVTWWRGLTGPNEFVLVRYHAKLAELDVQEDPKLKDVRADLTRLVGRMVQCVENRERIVDVVDRDLTIPRTGEMPKMLATIRTKVQPDKIQAFRELLKTELIPAYKKAGQTVVYARVRYGRPSNEFTSARAISSWADLDSNPLQKTMGEDAYQKFVTRLNGMVVESERNVYRHRADLSYIPAVMTSSSR